MPSITFETDNGFYITLLLSVWEILTEEHADDMITAMEYYPDLLEELLEAHNGIRDYLGGEHDCKLCDGKLDEFMSKMT